MLTAVLAYLEGSITVVNQEQNTLLLSDGTKVDINEFYKITKTTSELIERSAMVIAHKKLDSMPEQPNSIPAMDTFKATPPTPAAQAAPVDQVPTPENASHSHLVLGFGKYKESKLSDIQTSDPKWVSWMFNNCKLKAENGKLLVVISQAA